MRSNPGAWIVAGLSAIGLGGTIGAITLTPRLALPSWLNTVTYVAAAAVALCCSLFLFAMLWGQHSNWSNLAKTSMLLGALTSVPAITGLLVMVGADAVGVDGDPTVRSYFIAFGVAGLLLLAIPALLMTLMTGNPGH
jgi:hypothetical protein